MTFANAADAKKAEKDMDGKSAGDKDREMRVIFAKERSPEQKAAADAAREKRRAEGDGDKPAPAKGGKGGAKDAEGEEAKKKRAPRKRAPRKPKDDKKAE